MSERGHRAAELRRRAEARVAENGARLPPIDDVQARRLLHELQVHQVELELQNEELQASRLETEALLARYTELFDFAPTGFFHLLRDGSIRACNFAGARFLGLPRGALAGRPFVSFVRAEGLRAFDLLLRSAQGEETSASEEIGLLVNGVEMWTRLTVAPMQREAGSLLLAAEDVTARRFAEEGLRENAQRKDEFLAALSHELRNPLAPIRNALTLLSRLPAGSEKWQAALSVMDRQVTQLTRLVDDLLDVTRVARGKIRLQTDRIDLSALALGTVEDHRAAFDASGVSVSCTAAKGLYAEADGSRVAQVIGNLLGNALKFTNPGDRVSVALAEEHGEAVLRVKDTGVGMAPEIISHLFEPFAQGPQTLDRSRGGLGLGLATVKGITELHHGTVQAASEGPGRGAEFVVRLPLAAPPLGQARPASAADPIRPVRVLVVEDNPDAANVLKDLLELRGHDVRVALDGQTAIFAARALHPQLVLCDLGLPGISGYDLARALRAEEPLSHALIVALSGYAGAEDRRRAEEAGFDRHLAKPAGMAELDKLLAEASARLSR